MKKFFVFIIFIVSAVVAYSQTSSTDSTAVIEGNVELCTSPQIRPDEFSAFMHDAYKQTPEWTKYKTLRTVGWTTFGVGVATVGAGLYTSILLANLHGSRSDKTKAGPIVTFTGLGLTAASIPILACAYYYRHKAKKTYMSVGVTQLSAPTFGAGLSYTPAMNFTIMF